MRIWGVVVAGIFLAVLAGCGQNSAPSTAASNLMPADANLARIYAQTCKSCHATAVTGAPRAGDTNAWRSRVTQGMPVLLEHTINGYKGMPPLGSCGDCTEAEFEALIKFMSETRL